MRIKKHELSLLSTFSVKGRWWLPNAPDNRVGGTLKYSPNDVALELHGTITTTSWRDLGNWRDELDRVGLIHGDTDLGPCTLIRASLSSLDHNLTETTASTYSAVYLVIGTHITDPQIPSVTEVSFACSHLGEFLGSAAFTVEDDRKDGKFRGTTVRYVVPEPLVLALPSESSQLAFSVNLLRSESRSKISLTTRPSATLTPSTAQPFDWHLERIWRMCHLLSLLTDEQVRPERIEVSMEGESNPHILLYRTSGLRGNEPQSTGLLLFYSGHVFQQLGDILHRWFSASPTLTSAIHLFMDGQQQQGSSEGRFLSLTQAFEAFSRATTTSEYMAAADYEKVKSQIIGAIPANVASDHRDSLKARIKYGNEISLRKRLAQAVESLSPDAIDCVCKSPKQFVAGIVDTRNYLTHYTEELRASALRGANLFWASERVAMLLRILLLRELGIDIGLIVKRLREHHRLMQYRHLFHQHQESA